MPRIAKNPGSKPGRRTKEQEIREFVEATGGEISKLEDYLGGALEPMETPAPSEIRDELMRLLYERRGELKGIALVQGLKALAALATAEEEKKGSAEDEDDTRRPLLDRIDALPPDTAAALVKAELARTDTYRADLFTALARLEAAE